MFRRVVFEEEIEERFSDCTFVIEHTAKNVCFEIMYLH